MGAIDRAIFRMHPLAMALGVGERIQRLADDRPAFVTRNMGQRIALRRREGVGGRNHTLHRHRNCSGWDAIAWRMLSLGAWSKEMRAKPRANRVTVPRVDTIAFSCHAGIGFVTVCDGFV